MTSSMAKLYHARQVSPRAFFCYTGEGKGNEIFRLRRADVNHTDVQNIAKDTMAFARREIRADM